MCRDKRVETKRYVGETKELQVVASVRFRNRVKVPKRPSVVLIFARKSRSTGPRPEFRNRRYAHVPRKLSREVSLSCRV